MTAPQERPAREDLADLHAYVVPVSPKMLGETLSVAQFALQELRRQRPDFQAGASLDTHLHHVQLLLNEIQRMRPTGPDGKHDSRHTPECGC